MVTRILFDPRRDLPDGTTVSNPVIVTATPTGIAENGAVVVLPTSLTFTITTSADLLQLVPTTASWKWRLVIRDAVTNVLHQQRTVLVPDQASIAYQALQDVDPVSLGNTVTAARNWDATFAQILVLLQAVTNASLDDVNSWTPNTAYTVGTLVLNPSQQFVTANQDFTSGSSYDPTKWTVQTLNLAGVQDLIAQQAATDSATYAPLPPVGTTPGFVATVGSDGKSIGYAAPAAGSAITATAAGVQFPDYGWGINANGLPTFYGVGSVPAGASAMPTFLDNGEFALIPTGA